MTMTTAQGLALVRIGLGLSFLMSAFTKTMGGWFAGNTEMLTGFINKNLEAAFPPYATFLEETVLPNAGLFAQLVVLGEWVAGISLTFGLLTRLGAIMCVWLAGNYLLAKGLMTPEATDDRIFVLAGGVIGLLAAQVAWSMDHALSDTFRQNPVSRWLTGLSERRTGTMAPVEIDDIRRRGSRAA
jgi:uncharacterized membrane protein YphA (DoxX/SURF4 family)